MGKQASVPVRKPNKAAKLAITHDRTRLLSCVEHAGPRRPSSFMAVVETRVAT